VEDFFGVKKNDFNNVYGLVVHGVDQ